MEDRCVCCGEIVPEGRMVCPRCEINGGPLPAKEESIIVSIDDERSLPPKNTNVFGAINSFLRDYALPFLGYVLETGTPMVILGFILKWKWLTYIGLAFNILGWSCAFVYLRLILKRKDSNGEVAERLPIFITACLISSALFWVLL